MTEHFDWSAFISCCVETMCLCCTLCEHINTIGKCFNNNNNEGNNFTNSVNPNGTFIAEHPYSPQQYTTSPYSPQPQLPPQQFGEQQFTPNAPVLENNYASNQSTAAEITSSNYLAPPPSYSEAMCMETQTQPQSSNSAGRHISNS